MHNIKMNVQKFIDNPSLEFLSAGTLRKDEWIALAEHYEITVRKSWRKIQIKNAVIKMLVNTSVIKEEALHLCEEEGATCLSENALRALELEVEQRKLEDREKERRFQLTMLEKKSEMGLIGEQAFDVTKCCKFVPVFDELDAEEYFLQFENVATSLSWPKGYWPIIAQTSFKGKGLSTYLSLMTDQQKDYSIVKESILQAYQLTPEFYQSKFRNSARTPNQTFIEYAHLLRKLHNRWIASRGVTTFDQLRELMVLEQYLNTLPYDIRVYLC